MQRSVLLAAGGTGGHLFPAYALAEELMRRGIVVDLATDERADRYRSGFPARKTYKIPATTLAGHSPVAAAKTALCLGKGIASAYQLLGKLKPSVVLGFGGYPTFPPLVAAKFRSRPSAIHEANAVMGRANRVLAQYVSAIATSFSETQHLEGMQKGKIWVTGNPVRQKVVECAKRAYRVPDTSSHLNLLIFGGSQGARYFSETVPPALALLPEDIRTHLRIVQQCREEDLAKVETAYQLAGIAAELSTFFRDLPERIAQSHLVISRSGASTVSEITVLGRPTLMVPLPNALDNDQLFNAKRLAEAGAGWCIEQADLDPRRLAHEIQQLFRAPERLAAAAVAAKAMGKPDAVSRLADLVEELAERR